MEDVMYYSDFSASGLPMAIKPPISCSYEPQPDITAFELAVLLPYTLGKSLYQEDWDKLGDATRHLKRV